MDVSESAPPPPVLGPWALGPRKQKHPARSAGKILGEPSQPRIHTETSCEEAVALLVALFDPSCVGSFHGARSVLMPDQVWTTIVISGAAPWVPVGIASTAHPEAASVAVVVADALGRVS